MIDLVKLKLLAGNGGNGRVSFRREKYVPKGGPDGGNGGSGGNIFIKGVKGLNTLRHFSGIDKYQAQHGQMGGKRRQTGQQGKDIVLEVPIGTVVWLQAENQASKERRIRFSGKAYQERIENKKELQDLQKITFRKILKSNLELEKYYLEKEGQAAPFREADDVLGSESHHIAQDFKKNSLKIIEILEDGQEIMICQGGFGGRGNNSFKSSTNTTPLEAEYGSFAEQKEVILELRLLADVGLVGLPNAGKSTLLSVITKARPKIANYPFTTIEPNLGILDGKFNGQTKSLVVADLPGLIEGASQGKGLGHQFLRHIENCQVLLYVLYLEESIVFDQEMNDEDKAAMLWQQYQDLKKELQQHNSELLSKKYVLSVNKMDLYTKQLIDAFKKLFKNNKEELLIFSGITGDGLDIVKKKLFTLH